MHSVAVSANVIKLSMALPLGLEEGRVRVSVTIGSGEWGWVTFHPSHDKLQFSPIFQKFREFATILRLPTFYCDLFALSVEYGSDHLSV
jgi:hypothetical protein